jgi:polysaccharide export outer membrane protein
MRGTLFLWLVLAVGFIARPVGAAETTIRVGDTIAISAFGLPELDKKAVVETSGEISYPLLGSIKAAGLSPSGLRQKIVEGLVQGGLAKDPRIGVEIASREPFYVTGDVIKPGAQPYAPNITVRSAVALAGGFDPGGARGARATVNPAEIEGQYETLALEFVKQRARIRTLESELAGRKSIQFDQFPNLPVQKDVVDKFDALVVDELKMRADDTEAEKAFLQNQIVNTEAQIAALVDLKNTQAESVRQETDQVSKFKALAAKGTVVEERLVNERRALGMAQDKLFTTTATLASSRRLLEDFQHKRQEVDATRRIALVKDLQDAHIAAAAAEARLSAVRLQLNVKGGTNQPRFVIYRESDGSRIRVDADEDAVVQPGDIIEIRFGTATAMAIE